MPQTTDHRPARDQRLRRGWTLRDLAQKCADKGAPVDYSHLARIERGLHTPGPKLRVVLAELLDLDIADLEAQPEAKSA
ncbi:helix-turn-helix transcriptional regulator [Streptomyces sp.]|uniref:helix-turn-helix domain-containing protein n=1 Tax=Streptomyces sp. TaxID=1931 RepID=UPI002F94A458